MKTSKFFGTDASNEISLFEYGLLVQPYTKDGRTDEYFCIYGIESDANEYFSFGSGYITEETVNGYITGKEFPSKKDIASFLSWNGSTKDEWLAYSFANKLYDLLHFWGYENILGSDYSPKSKEDAAKMCNLEYSL